MELHWYSEPVEQVRFLPPQLFAPLAQWIERQSSELDVGSSSLSRGALGHWCNGEAHDPYKAEDKVRFLDVLLEFAREPELFDELSVSLCDKVPSSPVVVLGEVLVA